MKNLSVILDFDDVLVDFGGAAAEIHDRSLEEMDQLFGTKENPRWWTGDDFWEPIDKEREYFWAHLKPLPWASSLIDLLCKEFKDSWMICTAPRDTPGCRRGKELSLKKMFGKDFDRFIMTKDKWILANKNRWLIDDSTKNIDAFIAHGGNGLLFPGRSNILDKERLDAVGYLLTQDPFKYKESQTCIE